MTATPHPLEMWIAILALTVVVAVIVMLTVATILDARRSREYRQWRSEHMVWKTPPRDAAHPKSMLRPAVNAQSLPEAPKIPRPAKKSVDVSIFPQVCGGVIILAGGRDGSAYLIAPADLRETLLSIARDNGVSVLTVSFQESEVRPHILKGSTKRHTEDT